MLLTELFPQLASEVERLLRAQGEVTLAAQVATLEIVDRCRCGDDFCSSFYTQPKPEGRYGPSHRCVDLDAANGTLILDIVRDKIAHVEVLNREYLRETLVATFQ